ncbi:2-amino-4-hydroxy-6-hydroxymethyldihydropteridine diphosphokinase [Heyndrickxia acidiproducens]|uniref:2-amino-4-hydroxy-6- hydroxymethyldihydropteridine diphosphokinase n=1 Tax=Heyndrickxia acidiproducens TaxID=1121084 RepID=UPI00036CF685|nr:2-amino-4-hydroxy-6-hydroxymethyldihydropteridine diphosphokinase [Heyndrickxia acidiproducens]
MNHIAYLSLGSNIEPRLTYLQNAVKALQSTPGIELDKVSSIYETDPVGYTEQGNFLNMAVRIKTVFTALELLETCLSIEQQLGRERKIHWGPRTIDLDILLYNHENMKTEKLVLPHPRMHERAFVLVPLLELEPGLVHPVKKIPLMQMWNDLSDKEGVRLWRQINGEDVSVLFEN